MALSEKEVKETKQYKEILKAFEEAIQEIEGNEDDFFYVVSVLADIRFKHLMSIVSDGLLITYEYAIDILKNNINKRKDDIDDHNALVLISAMENLLAFSVCEEYSFFDEYLDVDLESENYKEEQDKIFLKYHGIWALTENNVVLQSAVVANAWGSYNDNDILQYTTQRDGLVRPEHEELDGFKSTKKDFPRFMIPPSDYNCRCFLVRAGSADFIKDERYYDIMSVAQNKVSAVFTDSLAVYGMIFNEEHRYFDVDKADQSRINDVCEYIKNKNIK